MDKDTKEILEKEGYISEELSEMEQLEREREHWKKSYHDLLDRLATVDDDREDLQLEVKRLRKKVARLRDQVHESDLEMLMGREGQPYYVPILIGKQVDQFIERVERCKLDLQQEWFRESTEAPTDNPEEIERRLRKYRRKARDLRDENLTKAFADFSKAAQGYGAKTGIGEK